MGKKKSKEDFITARAVRYPWEITWDRELYKIFREKYPYKEEAIERISGGMLNQNYVERMISLFDNGEIEDRYYVDIFGEGTLDQFKNDYN